MKSISELVEAVRDARNEAENEAIRCCPKKGIIRSRGAWIIVKVPGEGDARISDGMLPFKGTKKQIDGLIAEFPGAGIYVEGGFNYAESLQDFFDGAYDSWVSEWSVEVQPEKVAA